MDGSCGSYNFTPDDQADMLKPMDKKEINKDSKISSGKIVPNAEAPKKTQIASPKDLVKEEFGSMDDLSKAEKHSDSESKIVKSEDKQSGGKIVRQGGDRRFDE